MNYTEQAVTFACKQESLVGILAVPKTAASSTGVIVIVGGPQYRVGSHRQFALLSRALAEAGYPVLRFDYRGMGDSTGEQRDFLQVTPDIAAAIDAMQRKLPAVKRVALWGLCDAASAALLYCHDTKDERVGGLCLLNPWVRSDASLARTHVKHYYTQRLIQKEFWAKLASGRVTVSALAGLWQNIRLMTGKSHVRIAARQQPFQQRMANAWGKFPGNIMILLSGADYAAKEFLEYASIDGAWSGMLGQRHIDRHDLADADHTFSNAVSRAQVAALTLNWLQRQTAQ